MNCATKPTRTHARKKPYALRFRRNLHQNRILWETSSKTKRVIYFEMTSQAMTMAHLACRAGKNLKPHTLPRVYLSNIGV